MASDGGVLFRPVARSRAPEEIVGQIRELITSGGIRSGDRLPAERELARILGVGRTTIREAMRALESLRIVETRPGQGTFLVEGEAPFTIIPRPRQTWEGQQAIFEARLVIEPQIAAFAARRAKPDDLTELRRLLEEQAAQVRAGETGTQADLAFHTALNHAAGNPVLRLITESLAGILRENRSTTLKIGDRPALSLREHRAVLAAIEARDEALAHRRMAEHLEAVRRFVFAVHLWTQSPSTGDSPPPGVEAAEGRLADDRGSKTS